MHQRVGFERDQGVDVIGGGDAHRLGQPADVADVAADLVGVADADAHQLEQRVLEDLGITIRPTKPVPQTTTRFAPRCDISTSSSASPRVHPKLRWQKGLVNQPAVVWMTT